ncbi:MAG TPA: TraB family protein, partial [Anaerovoracaceae bacterium]|nr:TraB family protein [Anaerovoracaceae bacterium]
FLNNIQTGLEQLSAWVLWTGALAAIFTALSLGHPLSILTSFVMAPFTTLNPLLACGWFTGLVEASIRKPTVKDLQNVSEDISSFKGFFKNRLLRIILVVFMANIGASLGTFIAGAGIIRNLF